MQTLGRLVIKLRIPILAIVALLTGYFGYQALNLRVNSDVVTYLPPHEEAVQLFKKVGNTFGGNSLIMVALQTDGETLFTKEGLGLLRQIALACEKTEGVQNTISISNILDVRKIEGGIEVKKLIAQDQLPESAQELKEIQERALSKDMYNGKLVSSDGRLATVVIRVAEGVDRGELALSLRTMINQIVAGAQGGEAHYTVFFGGLPIWTAALSEIILHDITFLVPFVVIVLIVILFISFRSVRGVVLPLLNVGVAVVWVMGLMSLFGMQLTMISDVIPVLLMAVGSAYGIHFINAYTEDLIPGEKPRERLPKVTARIGVPILMAAATTFAGFVTFVTSYLSLFVEFGILTAIGVALAFVLALTMVPAILSFLAPGKRAVSEGPNLPIMQRLLSGLGRSSATHKLAWGCLFLVLLLAMALGATRITRSVNLSAYFPEEHYIQQSDKILDKYFGGTAPLQILVRGDIKDPFVLKQMLEVEKYLDSLPRVSGSNSLASLLAETNEQLNGQYAIPDSPEGVGNLFTFLEGDDILERMVYPTGSDRPSMALIQAFMSTGDSALLVETSGKVRDYLKENTFTAWELVPLEDSEKFGPSMSELQKGRIARASRLIRFDISKRLSDREAAEVPEVEPLLLEVFGSSPGTDPGVAKELVQVMMAYVTGDESLVSLSGDEEKSKLEQELAKVVKGAVSKETLLAALKGGLKPETVEEDVESVEDTAASLLRRYQEHVQSILVDRAMARIQELVPQELASSEWFVRDVKGDLWELMDRFTVRRSADAQQAEFSPVAKVVAAAKRMDPDSKGGFGTGAAAYTADPESILLEALFTPIPFKELQSPDSVKEGVGKKAEEVAGALDDAARSELIQQVQQLVTDDQLTQYRVAKALQAALPKQGLGEAWEKAGQVVAQWELLVREERNSWAQRMLEGRLDGRASNPDGARELFAQAVGEMKGEQLLGNHASFAATGMPRVYEEMDNNLIMSQLQSLFLALILTFILLTIQFKSLVAGAIALVPIIFTVVSEFGLMALAGVALDTATVLIASLAVGIGIDYTIHYMARLKLEAGKHASLYDAICETSRTTGVAIVINAVSVAAGFVILVAANLVPLQNFGWMTATTMVISSLAALTLLPWLLSLGKGADFLRRELNRHSAAEPQGRSSER